MKRLKDSTMHTLHSANAYTLRLIRNYVIILVMLNYESIQQVHPQSSYSSRKDYLWEFRIFCIGRSESRTEKQYGRKSTFSSLALPGPRECETRLSVKEALVRLLLLRLTKVSNCPSTDLSAHVHLISLVDLVVNELQE